MRSILSDIVTALTFDLVLLPGRLRRMKDPGERTAMVMLTLVSDGARCFVAAAVYAVYFA